MTAYKRPCPHGRYDKHTTKDGEYVVLTPDKWGQLLLGPGLYEICPGGEFLADDVIVIEKVDGQWPAWITDPDGPVWRQCGGTDGLLDDIADSLAARQNA